MKSDAKPEGGGRGKSNVRPHESLREKIKPPSKPRRSPIPPGEAVRPDRRREILLSAEKLFAQHGFQAVSIRDIAKDASVPIALVGYYFGRKQELFATIFEHRKSYIEDRLERIRALDLSGPGLVEKLVRAWVEPALNVRATEAGEAFSLLVARAVWDPAEESQRVIERYYDELVEAFIDAMGQAMPECDRGTLTWGYQYALGALLMFMADRRIERLTHGKERAGDPSRTEDLVAFIVAGFEVLRNRRRGD